MQGLNFMKRKSSERESRLLLSKWKYQKTKRTESVHAIVNTPQISDKPRSQWKSSQLVREITYHITGRHTYHAQENLELLRKFLNRSIKDENKIFRKTTWRIPTGRFESYDGIFAYSFRDTDEPTMKKVLLELLRFVAS